MVGFVHMTFKSMCHIIKYIQHVTQFCKWSSEHFKNINENILELIYHLVVLFYYQLLHYWVACNKPVLKCWVFFGHKLVRNWNSCARILMWFYNDIAHCMIGSGIDIIMKTWLEWAVRIKFVRICSHELTSIVQSCLLMVIWLQLATAVGTSLCWTGSKSIVANCAIISLKGNWTLKSTFFK